MLCGRTLRSLLKHYEVLGREQRTWGKKKKGAQTVGLGTFWFLQTVVVPGLSTKPKTPQNISNLLETYIYCIYYMIVCWINSDLPVSVLTLLAENMPLKPWDELSIWLAVFYL